MNKCKFCGAKTKNPKFCSRSCAISFNNKGVRRHGKEPNKCLSCGLETRNPKFCSNKCQKKYETKERVQEYWKSWKLWSGLKKYTIEQRGHRCEMCGNSTWNNKQIPIEMDHIDGNSDNNEWSNLRLVCPNCHAQTDTYKSKNKGSGRHYRRKRYEEGKSF